MIDDGKVNTGQRAVFHLPYVGEPHCDLDRRVRFVVHGAFDDVNVVTVYNVRRAFKVVKDVLPTNLLSKVVYSFECRQCDSTSFFSIESHPVSTVGFVSSRATGAEIFGGRPLLGRELLTSNNNR